MIVLESCAKSGEGKVLGATTSARRLGVKRLVRGSVCYWLTYMIQSQHSLIEFRAQFFMHAMPIWG